MPDMPQERAGGLVELLSPVLPLDVVRLRHIDGDHPIGAAREHRPCVRLPRIREKGKGEALRRVVGCGHQGQPQVPEAVEQAAFGDFEPVPGGVMAGLAQVGEYLGEAAGQQRDCGSSAGTAQLQMLPCV